jgi:hypothetical protein
MLRRWCRVVVPALDRREIEPFLLLSNDAVFVSLPCCQKCEHLIANLRFKATKLSIPRGILECSACLLFSLEDASQIPLPAEVKAWKLPRYGVICDCNSLSSHPKA